MTLSSSHLFAELYDQRVHNLHEGEEDDEEDSDDEEPRPDMKV